MNQNKEFLSLKKNEPLMIKTGLKGFLETEVIPIDKNGFYRIRHEREFTPGP